MSPFVHQAMTVVWVGGEFVGGGGGNKLVNKLDHKWKENSFKRTLYSVPIDRACVASVFVIPFKCLGIDIQREHTLSQYVSCMLSLLSSWLQKLVWSTTGTSTAPVQSPEQNCSSEVWNIQRQLVVFGMLHQLDDYLRLRYSFRVCMFNFQKYVIG